MAGGAYCEVFVVVAGTPGNDFPKDPLVGGVFWTLGRAQAAADKLRHLPGLYIVATAMDEDNWGQQYWFPTDDGGWEEVE